MSIRCFTLFLVLLCFFSPPAIALNKGFNQAWFKTDYSYQWLDGYYDKTYAEKIIQLNKDANSTILRMWLFEGSSLLQFERNMKSGDIIIKNDFIKNLRHFLKLARKHHLKISLTFLDGNAFSDLVSNPDLLSFWWKVFNDKDGMLEKYYQSAVLPIYQLVQREFSDVVVQFDLVNEVNALMEFKMFENYNQAMSNFLCKLRTNAPSQVTASLGWANADDLFFSGFLNNSCLDYYDLHYYNDSGEIPRCEDFKVLHSGGINFQLGEFGQLSPAFDDELQSSVTLNFLKNAKRCKFNSAFAWRLVDFRPGNNTEARYSFIAFSRPRLSYFIFKNF